mgnify:CR=1 FL=1
MINSEDVIYTDRSRIETGQRCARRRWWEYHYQLPGMEVAGVQPAKPALELSVGSAVHKGIENLLKWVMESGVAKTIPNTPYPDQGLDSAIEAALAEFKSIWDPWLAWSDQNPLQTLVRDEWDPETETYAPAAVDNKMLLTYQLSEAEALIEALVAAFYYSPSGLELIANNYQILAVEQEIQLPLAVGLVLNSRPDAILRHKTTGQYFAWSLKTAKKWTDQTNQQAEVDNQGISESIATEFWLNKELEKQNPGNWVPEADYAVCSGVLMCYLIKGEKRKNDLGIYATCSPLIRPYFNTQSFDHTDFANYAPSGMWTCTEEHEWKGARFGYKVNGVNGCPGGKNHMRGDAWKQVNLWEIEGVRIQDWVGHLLTEQPEIGLQLVQVPAPYKREREEMQEWLTQVVTQEADIKNAVEIIYCTLYEPQISSMQPDTALSMYFPKNRTACVYPWKCTWYDTCHKGGQSRLLDPTLFQLPIEQDRDLVITDLLNELNITPRVPNHPEREGEPNEKTTP